MFSRDFASSLARSSFGSTTGESIWDFYFPGGWSKCFLKPGCPSYNWLLRVALLLRGSDLPSLHAELLINSPVPAEEILSREAVEKHLLLCLKLLLVVLVTINLWGDLSSYCKNRRYKLLNGIRKHEKIENLPNKNACFVSDIPNSSLFSLILEVVKKMELRCCGGAYHLETKPK